MILKFVLLLCVILIYSGCAENKIDDSGKDTEYGEISGRVYNNTTLDKVQGAEVFLFTGGLDYTDSDGFFNIKDVKAGDVYMRVSADGFADFFTNFSLNKNENKNIAFFINPIFVLSATVYNRDSQLPVLNGIVGVSDEFILTRNNGRFVVSSEDGFIQFTISAAGYEHFSTNFILERGVNSISFLITPSEETEFSVVTYNVEDFDRHPYSYGMIANYVKDADIIGFQEIQPEDESPFNEKLLSKRTIFPYYEVSSVGGYPDNHLAYWSRFEVKQSVILQQNSYPDPAAGTNTSLFGLRPIHGFEVNIRDEYSIWFYNLHLKAQVPWGETNKNLSQRRAQAYLLKEYILANHDTANDHIIIFGDVNSALGLDFDDTNTMGILTFRFSNPDNPNRFTPINVKYLPDNAWTHTIYDSRLDHIILSPKVYERYVEGSVEIVAMTNSGALEPSDHYPVSIRLRY